MRKPTKLGEITEEIQRWYAWSASKYSDGKEAGYFRDQVAARIKLEFDVEHAISLFTKLSCNKCWGQSERHDWTDEQWCAEAHRILMADENQIAARD